MPLRWRQYQPGLSGPWGRRRISVTANVAPTLCARMIKATRTGDFATARSLKERLMDLHMALFLEPSPAGIKYAMSRVGLCVSDLRAPWTVASSTGCRIVDAALAGAGVL